jgi:hypothetical protein
VEVVDSSLDWNLKSSGDFSSCGSTPTPGTIFLELFPEVLILCSNCVAAATIAPDDPAYYSTFFFAIICTLSNTFDPPVVFPAGNSSNTHR